MTPASELGQDEKKQGSPVSGEPVFVAIGKLRRPHGVRGEIGLELLTDFPQRIREGKVVLVGEQHLPLRIASRREKPPGLLVSFEGYDDCDKVAVLTNQYLYMQADKLPALPDGEYYFHELIGMAVEDSQGRYLGVMTEILETGANDVFLITTPDGQEILAPVINSVLVSVDLQSRVVRINLPEWE